MASLSSWHRWFLWGSEILKCQSCCVCCVWCCERMFLKKESVEWQRAFPSFQCTVTNFTAVFTSEPPPLWSTWKPLYINPVIRAPYDGPWLLHIVCMYRQKCTVRAGDYILLDSFPPPSSVCGCVSGCLCIHAWEWMWDLSSYGVIWLPLTGLFWGGRWVSVMIFCLPCGGVHGCYLSILMTG